MSDISRRAFLKTGAAATLAPTAWLRLNAPAEAADPCADARLVNGPPPLPQNQFALTIPA